MLFKVMINLHPSEHVEPPEREVMLISKLSFSTAVKAHDYTSISPQLNGEKHQKLLHLALHQERAARNKEVLGHRLVFVTLCTAIISMQLLDRMIIGTSGITDLSK